MTDNYYQVGDVIKYDNNLGKVTAIGLKTTRIEDINTMNVVSIANRKIQKVEKESHTDHQTRDDLRQSSVTFYAVTEEITAVKII